MSLLTFSTPLEQTSSFPTEFKFLKTLNNGRRVVASFSPRITRGVRRCNSLKLNNEVRSHISKASNEDLSGNTATDEETLDLGVRAALTLLKFYRREISPFLPQSCRYVPSCSVYSMEAYKKYGFVKGTIMTTWRLCRCNPLGGHGFDPPRWFGEEKLSDD